MQSRIILEPHRVDGDTLEIAATFESGREPGKLHRLWWRLPAALQNSVSTNADPFLIAFLFPLMQARCETIIEGAVSPSLLENLDLFMDIWQMWHPALYQKVPIRAVEESESPPPPIPNQTIIPFSCGLDSCYTALRHHRQLLGRRNRNITAALVMQGFDIRLDQPHADAIYNGLLADARTLLASLNIDCIPISSNFHELPTTWAHSHGSHLAAGLMLLAPRFDSALIPNSLPCTHLGVYWGTNPVTDPLFSTTNFRTSDDGGEIMRIDKFPLVAQWPEAMKHLRVCFENPQSHTNCCRCEKCIQAILAFRIHNLPRPPAFPTDITDRQIARLRFHKFLLTYSWTRLFAAIPQHHRQNTSWAKALRTARRRNARREKIRALQHPFIPLRNHLRHLFRGSPLSQKQRAALSPPRTNP